MQLPEAARRFLRTRHFKIFAVAAGVLFVISATVVVHFYTRYSRMIDLRLSGQVFENTAKIYDASGNLVTSLSGAQRAKRRLVEFQDIPKQLIDAVTAGEDRKFFNHYGIDPRRIAGALIWNIREDGPLQGGSTITQQLARSFFLSSKPTLRRKINEAFIAILLEARLTKEQVFAMYANEIYLGERGPYSVHGFGEAARAFFGKDLSDLTLAETATLAGIIPAPNAYSPGKHPDRAVFRRNLILKAMRESGAITEKDYQTAKEAGLEVINSMDYVTEAPYFVDYIRDELLKHYSDDEVLHGGYHVYTTLDMGLQKAAVDAVTKGLQLVDREIAARDKKKKNAEPLSRPQAALIAVDPRTGEIKAMVGGSDYTATQYNRIARAFRQPGSVFKPFVYAAALESAYDADVRSAVRRQTAEEPQWVGDYATRSIRDRLFTPLTVIEDAPKTFLFGGEIYEPNNFKGSYLGEVTLRTALQRSLNSATIQVAEKIGYRRVAAMAHRLGLNSNIKGYPSVAIGAFEVTPLELAGAYTAFANEGRRVEPHAIRRVETPGNSVPKDHHYPSREVLRPQIAYLMTYLMQGVIDRGTAAKVRAHGFRLPAAGKTGTSRDGWFAGYTKDLLVITWVGFDDNRDLNLEGSRSALPIWTEFMLKAYSLRPPRGGMHFRAPSGIEFVTVDPESGMLATPDCENTFEEAFISGTQPGEFCPLHSFDVATEVPDPLAEPATASDIIRAKPTTAP